MNASLVISLVSVTVAIASALVAYASYRRSRQALIEQFRPIVTARVIVEADGNLATCFKMVVENTGNRGARNIELRANENELDKELTGGKNDALVQDVRRCFSTVIPVLAPGQEVSNSFGSLGRNPAESTWRQYRTLIPIRVTYEDLENPQRKFRHAQPLLIAHEDMFAGGRWGRS